MASSALKTGAGGAEGEITSRRQHTIAGAVELHGRGVHSGHECRLRILPAPDGTGFVFRRVDLDGSPKIPGSISNVVHGELARRTTLSASGAKVFTVEHALSALVGVGIDNALIEMDSAEPPFLDGSAALIADAVAKVGITEQTSVCEPIRIAEPIVFADAGAEIVALPSTSFRVSYFYSSNHPGLRTQSATFELPDAVTYRREIAPARTFCFVEEIEELRRSGLAKGASLASAVVIGRKAILNETLRFPDEPVRHKILDFMGDLALLGRPLQGHFLAWRSGHRANALFALHLSNVLGLNRTNVS